MRSDFIATISRYQNHSIDTEMHEDESAALTDLLGSWDGDAKGIGVLIIDNMDCEQSNEILRYLLCDLDGDVLHSNLLESGYDMEGDAMKDLVKLLIEGLSAEAQKSICLGIIEQLRKDQS